MGSLENEFYQIKAKAENGNVGAQGLMGFAYLYGQCVPQDNTRAMMWGLIAKVGIEDSPDTIALQDNKLFLQMVERRSTPAQIADAQRLAREWWAAHPKKN